MKESPDLRSEFLDEEYAHSYMEEFLNASIATQLKVLREQRGWNQTQLAERAGMKQERISVLEDVNYSSWSVRTLRRLARAFDLRLKVSFETFSGGIKEVEAFGRTALERESRADDLMRLRPGIVDDAKVIDFLDRLKKKKDGEAKAAAPLQTAENPVVGSLLALIQNDEPDQRRHVGEPSTAAAAGVQSQARQRHMAGVTA